jgi:hypothetical protein
VSWLTPEVRRLNELELLQAPNTGEAIEVLGMGWYWLPVRNDGVPD